MSPDLDRRSFLKLVGGGIVVLVRLEPSDAPSPRASYPKDFNAYLRVGEDGRVTVFSGKIEMGQGVMTSQAQMAAEELGVALDSIEMVLGDTDRCPWDAGTWGSLTTRMFGPCCARRLRRRARFFFELAAEKLGRCRRSVSPSKNGIVSVKGEPARQVSYGALARGQAIVRTLDEEAVLRSVEEFKVMGRSPQRLDAEAKVTGAAEYAADIRLPGLLYARILRPPAHGATLAAGRHLGGGGDERGPGRRGGRARRGAARGPRGRGGRARAPAAGVESTPSPVPTPRASSTTSSAGPRSPRSRRSAGDVEAARAGAGRLFESTFRKGYVAHAPIEPHAATARMEDGKLTVWSSTQVPFPTRDRLTEVMGLDAKNVRVITPYVGGAFGGKIDGDHAEEAARLARITGRPVQVAYTRAEEFFYESPSSSNQRSRPGRGSETGSSTNPASIEKCSLNPIETAGSTLR